MAFKRFKIHFTTSKQCVSRYIPPITSWSVQIIIDEYDLIFEIFHCWYVIILNTHQISGQLDIIYRSMHKLIFYS